MRPALAQRYLSWRWPSGAAWAASRVPGRAAGRGRIE